MKPPTLERRQHGANEEEDGWMTLVSIQTNGSDMAVQIDEKLIPFLDNARVAKLISVLTDALYRVRPDLRPS